MWSPPNVKTVGWSKSMKIFFGVTVFVMVLLFILFILQQKPPYYSRLVWGTIFVIVGSSGSQLLPEWKKHKWRKWFRAVGIAIVIAFGALITTYGWNERTVTNKKNSLIRSVIQEWKINIEIITDQKFIEPNEEKLTAYTAYPRVQSSVLGGALSSGYFTDKSDPNFWTEGLGLLENITYFNNALRITENEMARNPKAISKIRLKVKDGALYKSFRDKLLLFGIIIVDEYGDMLKSKYAESWDEISDEQLDEIKCRLKSEKNNKKDSKCPSSSNE